MGHVYISQLTPEDKTTQIEEILAAMVSNYQKNIPSLLCGNFDMDEPSDGSHELLKTYFTYSSNTSTLLLRPGASESPNHQIETDSIYISGNHRGQLSSITPIQDHSIRIVSHKPLTKILQNIKNYIILCEANEGNDNNKNPTEQRAEREYERERERDERGRLELSLGSKSENGKDSVNGSLGYTSPKGWKGTVEGKFSQDSQGNRSHEIQGSVQIPLGGN